ncbi:MAG: thiamine-phosphate kinase [bacterium]
MKARPHLQMGEGAEFDAIRQMLAAWGAGALGIGDDAAVLDVPSGERLVVSTDATVEHVHFRREWLTAEEIGGRAGAAALSDLAAMAANPLGLLLALGLPDNWRSELESLARGLGVVAAAAGCPIVGGNVSAAGELSLTITVLGSTTQPLSRSGALAGDIIYVTGRLGGAGAALRALLDGREASAEHRARFVAPVPRVREARWLAVCGARAAIDISDGLLADASHLARASGVTLSLQPLQIPRMSGVSIEDAATSGEEYELLVAAPPSAGVRADEFEREFGIPLTAIGVATAPGSEAVVGLRAVRSSGHDHLG